MEIYEMTNLLNMEPNFLDMENGPFAQLLSFAEAAQLWGIDQSTLRKAVQSGRLVPGSDCRKFGKQWVISVNAMRREFGGWGPWNELLTEYRANLQAKSCYREYPQATTEGRD